MDCFVKIVKIYKYFSKMLCLLSLTGFWIRPSLSKYSWTCRVTSRYVLYEHIQNYGIFRNISIIVNLDTFSHIPILFKHIQPYYRIQNFAIFRVLACLEPATYSEPCLFNHIQAYSIMITHSLTIFENSLK